MKTFLLTAFAALALAGPPAAIAQTAPAPTPAPAAVDADPALWVVKDDDTTIYLFGTVHVLKPGLSWFDEGVKKAFDASDQLVLEMVPPPDAVAGPAMMKIASNPTGPALSDKLPADLKAKYEKAMTDNGVPVAAFERMDPWFPGLMLSLIPLQKLGYSPDTGAERVLMKAAEAANKPISGVETFDEQLGFFDTLPEPAQIGFLRSTIDSLPRVQSVFDSMVVHWSAGDPDALGKVMNEELRETPEVGKVLLSDRNARWADWIDTRLDTPGKVFMAVGAGHLAGPDSVQVWLGKRDLKATRVAY
ncbi:TraB/GumN family protein [Sphingomonas japonica]|uniref:TraB family protein n=1 Tax=Sphingomonas japonica TaxID=511662 RepID=A0ABX0TWW7_9SPHN|nr:TraB/GumN family protein [Sphingomonas japonica]NIJ22738.1 hypothetical protein [Sphingomonas japonica]